MMLCIHHLRSLMLALNHICKILPSFGGISTAMSCSPLSTSALVATNETWQQMCKLHFKWVFIPVCPCQSALSSSPSPHYQLPDPPVPSLMAASSDFTPAIYQAALILKLINNSDKTALSSACKDSWQSEAKLKEINSPLFLQHLNTALPGSITSTHHTSLSATRHQKGF